MTDYVKSYIGEGKSAKNFAKEYLERRSRSRNAAKQRRQYEDDLLTPAAAVNPNAGADSDFIPVANSANQASLSSSVVCLRICIFFKATWNDTALFTKSVRSCFEKFLWLMGCFCG